MSTALDSQKAAKGLVWLILFLLTSLLLGQAFMLFFLTTTLGTEQAEALIAMPTRFPEYKTHLTLALGISHLTAFILPSFFFWKFMDTGEGTSGIRFNQPLSLISTGAIILLILVALPFVGWSGELNKSMTFPESWADLERSLTQMEEEAARLSEMMLKIDNLAGLFLALLVLAVLPAIGEEMIFRGLIQGKLQVIIKNHHIAIWLAAFVFSAMHLQFYGFLPRLFLGAFFGYLYVWSGNILVPILAHLANNASVVLLAYSFEGGLTQENINKSMESMTWYMGLSSMVLALLIGFWLKKHWSEAHH
ncbi:MAG: CPBP family intramembrane metalloprotease [Cytophagales bacterium]|nr:MAG: CPBP family intramembrane metalloprotease [Cytophagales bacterium]TAF61369.1 MAG: CPBP family intramembrane metalloprotease [Cytophagales bacterium]